MAANKAPNNNVFYRSQTWHYPKIERGEGVFIFGADGKRYIDACSGSAVANIGHANTDVEKYFTQSLLNFLKFLNFITIEIN